MSLTDKTKDRLDLLDLFGREAADQARKFLGH